ncbi:MAG TPA: choice-of-anchor tandem repeat GloVer-containing protein [Verrucomicrobiae bacterium]
MFGLTLAAPARPAGPPQGRLIVLDSFPGGWTPSGGLVLGSNGNLFGVTSTGGPQRAGGIYEVATNGLLTVIWFTGANGSAPLGPLAPDHLGNFYGTTSSGGIGTNGTVFRLNRDGSFQTLAFFRGTNGSKPNGPLLLGTNGWHYGVTFNGGSNNFGTVFRVSAAGILSNVFSFDGGGGGANPASGLVQGPNGELFGTTQNGASNGIGTAFEMTYSGALTTLASFTGESGVFPGALVESANGTFFGPAANGGSNFAGTIFEMSPSGNVQTLSTFALTNGAIPNSPLFIGDHGVLFGTTEEGGVFGMGTIFHMNSRGSLATLFSFSGGPGGALPDSGVIETPDGNFFGTTSTGGTNNSGIVYELTDLPPFIVIPPQNQKWVKGGTARFSVTASGSQPLSYQWQFDGTNVVSDIPGETNTTLTVGPEQLANAGLYTVLVTNAFGAASASAVLNVTPPVIAFTTPAAGTRTNQLVVTGTTSAQGDVALVNFWITNVNAGINLSPLATFGTAVVTSNGTTSKWSVTNASILPGTNFFTVQSMDTVSNESTLVTREFFVAVPVPFALMTNGAGSIGGSAAFPGARPTNKAMLNVGEGYTLIAMPSNHYVFSNWTSSTGFTSGGSTLHFIMESNLSITANFIPNPFIGAAGTFNGLFSLTNEVTEQTAGMVRSLIVRSNGTYTGTLLLGGAAYGLSGTFNVSGFASKTVNRTTARGGPVSVEMNLDLAAGEITGSVSGTNGGPWVSALQAGKSIPSPSAEYTVLLDPSTNAIGKIPPGDGYMLLTNHLGSVTLSGALADGSTFSQIVPENALGVPVCDENLYGSAGLLWGWLSLGKGAAGTNLTWIKPRARSGIYTNGFTNALSITGSAWITPPLDYLPAAMLAISNGSFAPMFAVSITNRVVAKASSPPTNSLTGIFYPAAGLLRITFGNGIGRGTTYGYAAILQDTATGGGYFLTRTNAGAITLSP